ncbi:MAG TPA: tetratricopeptide repeat protein, partial [Cryomorphaceae bacterium]|nr:tetratricopeptide repeat protein [Cryomorphaceae bacterium]
LALARRAYNLATDDTPPEYRYKAAAYYGYHRSYESLEEGVELLNRGFTGFWEAGLVEPAVLALYDLGFVYEEIGPKDSAISAYERTYRLAKANDLKALASDAAYSNAYILYSTGKIIRAMKWAERSEEILKGTDDPARMSMTLNQIGIIYDNQGVYSKAIEYYLQAKELAVEAEDTEAEMILDNNLATVYMTLKDTVKANTFYNKALETAQFGDFKASEATFLNNLSEIELHEGDTASAIAMLKRSLQLVGGTPDTCFASYPLEGLGTIFMHRNEPDSARHFYAKALAQALDCKEALITAGIYNQLGRLDIKEGHPRAAIERFESALGIAEKGLMAAEIKIALEGLYQAEKDAGNIAESLRHLEEYQSFSDSLNRSNEVSKASGVAAEYEFKNQLALQEARRKERELRFDQTLEAEEKVNMLIIIGWVTSLVFTAIVILMYFLIRKKNQKLNKLNADKNRLMGIVAHDLRGPLKNIEGLLKLAEETDDYRQSSSTGEYLRHIGHTTVKMTDLINRVMSISAIENMEENLKMQRVNLQELLVLVANNFRLSAARKDIVLKLCIDRSRDYFASVDPRYLEQAIDNLVSNAIKYTEMGKEVQLVLKSTTHEHIIEVNDQGPGIRQEEIHKLFQEFTTLDSKPTHHESSTGLGLFIAHRFVYAMDGSIEVASRESGGSTFRIIFKKK